MKIKKIISVTLSFFTLLSLIPSFSVQAESDEYESDMELIQKAYDLYAMMYEAYEIPEFTDPDEHPITDEYTEKASETYGIYFKRFSNGVLTKEDFVEYISSYFAPDIANSITKETRWFKIIDGNVVMHFDGTMGWLFTRSRTEKERIIERTADTVTYEVFFYVHNTSGNGPEESRTFIIKHGENGSRIIGGTFIEEAFQIEIENPINVDAVENGSTDEDIDTVYTLLNQTFELYKLMYSGFSESSKYVSLPPDEYLENELSAKLTSYNVSQFYALNEDFNTRQKLVLNTSRFLSSKLAESVIRPSTFLYIEGETLAYRYDATNKYKYVMLSDNDSINIRIISRDSEKVTYSFTIDCNDQIQFKEEKTVIIEGKGNNARITGGTFIDDAFKLNGNPQTSDAPIIAVCVLAASAAAAAVILKKKRVL